MKPLNKKPKQKHISFDLYRWESLYDKEVYEDSLKTQEINIQLGLTQTMFVLQPGWIVELVFESDDPKVAVLGGVYQVVGTEVTDNPSFQLLDRFIKYSYKKGDYMMPLDMVKEEAPLMFKDITKLNPSLYICCKDSVKCEMLAREVRAHRNSPRLIPKGHGKELTSKDIDMLKFLAGSEAKYAARSEFDYRDLLEKALS